MSDPATGCINAEEGDHLLLLWRGSKATQAKTSPKALI